MSSANFYEVCGVSKNFTPDELRKSYKKLRFELHPDKNFNDPQGATVKFQFLQQAYETLSDPALHKKYDQDCELSQESEDSPSDVSGENPQSDCAGQDSHSDYQNSESDYSEEEDDEYRSIVEESQKIRECEQAVLKFDFPRIGRYQCWLQFSFTKEHIQKSILADLAKRKSEIVERYGAWKRAKESSS
jgi:curved DNA-binding protein CbpA